MSRSEAGETEGRQGGATKAYSWYAEEPRRRIADGIALRSRRHALVLGLVQQLRWQHLPRDRWLLGARDLGAVAVELGQQGSVVGFEHLAQAAQLLNAAAGV